MQLLEGAEKRGAPDLVSQSIELAARSTGAATPAGTPIAPLALLIGLRHVENGVLSPQMLAALRGQVASNPSFLTTELLHTGEAVAQGESASRLAVIDDEWRIAEEAREKKRALIRKVAAQLVGLTRWAAILPDGPSGEWVALCDRWYDGWAVRLIPNLKPRPPKSYLGLMVQISQQTWWLAGPENSKAKVLAVSTGIFKDTQQQYTVRIDLADPDQLYLPYPGRPRIDEKLEALIVRMAQENSGWGYARIVGALANLGYTVSDQTVGNVLRRHGIAPAPQRGRTMSWKDFLAAHMNVLAGADFFTVEVLKWQGLVTYYVLFFLHLETRRITVAGITRHPDGEWMEQIALSATQETWGYLNRCRYVLHDRDKKFCASFRSVLSAAGVKPLMLPAKSPNLNAYAERWVRSVKQECLSKLILLGEGPLQRSLAEYTAHYHLERNHQGKGNQLLTPQVERKGRKIHCHHRLGGLLKFYARAA